jgi:hypothetical protein
MNLSDTLGPALQDPLTMSANRLGEAKTEATKRGLSMLDSFERLKKAIDELKSHGLAVTMVKFENPSIQAAWLEYSEGDSLTLMPMMVLEDERITRIQSRVKLSSVK